MGEKLVNLSRFSLACGCKHTVYAVVKTEEGVKVVKVGKLTRQSGGYFTVPASTVAVAVVLERKQVVLSVYVFRVVKSRPQIIAMIDGEITWYAAVSEEEKSAVELLASLFGAQSCALKPA